MRILLLTGIYPPQIGGPATYSYNLAKELTRLGYTVTVLSYGQERFSKMDGWHVHQVSYSGTFLQRYWRMRKAIAKHGLQVDLIYNFGTVSTGIPLFLTSGLRAPKVLRLGGDFAWERYTDWGGTLPLPDFYTSAPWYWKLVQLCMKPLIKQHTHVVFSTEWQQQMYLQYVHLPRQSHIANAVHVTGTPVEHTVHSPVRILSFGRLVRFKRIKNLVTAIQALPQTELTIAGDGPELGSLQALVAELGVQNRVRFIGKVSAEQKQQLFAQHDLLVIPSLSDISPNASLEAMACGLPVVLTHHNGLSSAVQESLFVCNLQTPEAIVTAIQSAIEQYDALKHKLQRVPERSWAQVTKEHTELFRGLV